VRYRGDDPTRSTRSTSHLGLREGARRTGQIVYDYGGPTADRPDHLPPTNDAFRAFFLQENKRYVLRTPHFKPFTEGFGTLDATGIRGDHGHHVVSVIYGERHRSMPARA
jgi:hypothetical protein